MFFAKAVTHNLAGHKTIYGQIGKFQQLWHMFKVNVQ